MFQLELARPIKTLDDILMTRECESLLHWREGNWPISWLRYRFRP